jgi:hypothetical protein
MKLARETGTLMEKSSNEGYCILSYFIGTRTIFQYEGEMVHFEPWEIDKVLETTSFNTNDYIVQ